MNLITDLTDPMKELMHKDMAIINACTYKTQTEYIHRMGRVSAFKAVLELSKGETPDEPRY